MLKQKTIYSCKGVALSIILCCFMIGCGKANKLNKEGLVLFEQHKIEDAIVKFQKALEIDPDHYDAHYALGMSFYATGMVDEALTELKTAASLRPDDPKGHFNLGFAYIDKENVPEAIKEYRKAIDLYAAKKDKKEADAYFFMSVAYSLIEQHDKALAMCKKATEINPDVKDGHYFLGVCYFKNDMTDEAIAELKKALIKDPRAEKAHSVLYVIYDKLGMVEDARMEQMIIDRITQERRQASNYQ